MNHPYYIVPVVERYKSLPPESEEAKKLADLISVNIGHRETLQSILYPEHLKVKLDLNEKGETGMKEDSQNTEAHEKEGGSMGTIDSFLDKFGSNLPVSGYLATAQLEDSTQEEPRGKREKKTEKEPSEQAYSELKKLIVSKKYEEAIQLIEGQNLNNPQKSIYFAHQMRFIKKLMAIDRYKTTNNG